jgi:mannose-6-phosphate isomerase-like protein (cupin superfamily)
MQVTARALSPLATWFPGAAALTRFRRRFGRAAVVLPPCDDGWRSVAPGFRQWERLTGAGLPFQIAAERRYDRSGDPRRLARGLAEGATVFFPQAHQVLPRLMRLMVALRVSFLRGGRDGCSFLFLARGRGREGMGLHHDGDVDAFWLQLEGRRTVTLGPPVPPRTPADLDEARARRRTPRGWVTLELTPGTLFYMPPRTPHRVLCFGRSLALSLTWRRGAGAAADHVEWDVVPGRVDRIPPISRDRIWTQVPALAGRLDRRRNDFPVRLPGGAEVRLPATAHPLARQLATMPSWALSARAAGASSLRSLVDHGLVAPRDLPLRIVPQRPRALDGWRFA